MNILQQYSDGFKPIIKVTKYTWISISAARASGAQAATIGLNGNGWIVASFADNLVRQVQANIKIPEDIDFGYSMTLCLGWSSPTVSQFCDWEVIYLLTAAGESTEQAGTTLQSLEQSSAVADGMIFSSSFTIAANLYNSNDMCIHLVVQRDGNDATDTLGDIAEVHGIALQYTANRLGDV